MISLSSTKVNRTKVTVTQRRTVTILSDFVWKLQIPRRACQVSICLWTCLCLMGLVSFLHFSLSLILYFWYQSCPLSSFNSAHYYPAQLCWFICKKWSTCMSPIFSLLSRTFSLLFIASFFTEPRFHQPTGHKAFTVCCKCLLFSAAQVSAFWEK